jgi:hypothetical protein
MPDSFHFPSVLQHDDALPGRFTAGLDLARRQDRSILTVVEHIDVLSGAEADMRPDLWVPARCRHDLILAAAVPASSYTEQIAWVADVLAPFGSHLFLAYDASGGGANVGEDIIAPAWRARGWTENRARPIVIGPGANDPQDLDHAPEDALIVRLAEQVASRQLRIAADLDGRDELIREALNLEPSLTARKRLLTFGAKKGHDDRVFSLAIAVWPRSRWADAKKCLRTAANDRRVLAPDGVIYGHLNLVPSIFSHPYDPYAPIGSNVSTARRGT